MALSQKQKNKIKKNAKILAASEASILIKNDKRLYPVYQDETKKFMSTATAAKITEEIADDLVTGHNAKYRKDMITKKGSMCVTDVRTPISNERIKSTTKREFIPWLDDLVDSEAKRISNIINGGIEQGKHPRKIAKELESHFAGTKHRAEVAARTESAKIRQDALFDQFKEGNVKYLKYTSAGDEKVRPEHAERDGKIYKIEEAPEIGAFDCRCILTEADYRVKVLGQPVEKTHTVIFPASALA